MDNGFPRTVVEFADFFDDRFLPSMALGLVLGVVLRVVPTGRLRGPLQGLAGLLFFLPQPLVLYLGLFSAPLRLYQQVFLAFWGLGLGVLIMVQLMSGPPFAKMGNHLVLAVGATALMAIGIYCGRTAVGDYGLQHDKVTGTVDGVIVGSPAIGSYQVIINHRMYNITSDLLTRFNNGDYVNAEVGIASNTILTIRRSKPVSP